MRDRGDDGRSFPGLVERGRTSKLRHCRAPNLTDLKGRPCLNSFRIAICLGAGPKWSRKRSGPKAVAKCSGSFAARRSRSLRPASAKIQCRCAPLAQDSGGWLPVRYARSPHRGDNQICLRRRRWPAIREGQPCLRKYPRWARASRATVSLTDALQSQSCIKEHGGHFEAC
jgi:hypothetical protein